jgi:hypothetical protein
MLAHRCPRVFRFVRVQARGAAEVIDPFWPLTPSRSSVHHVAALVGSAAVRAIALMLGLCSVAIGCSSEPAPTSSGASTTTGSQPDITSPGTTSPVITSPGIAATSTQPSGSGPLTTEVAHTPDATDLAAEIATVEQGIRDTSLTADQVADFGRRQQLAYRSLARHPEWLGQVTGMIPADVSTAFDFNVAARRAVSDHAAESSVTPPEPTTATAAAQPDTLPAWTIVEPRPVDELLADYREAERATGVPWQYLAAINFVETRMGRIEGVSSAGAVGPMQFLPSTWAQCCTGDVTDPHDAILGAAAFLAANGAPGDMGAALYAYNPNSGYVGSVTAYAQNMITDPLAYRGYHAWQVLVGTDAGTVRLPIGYSATSPVDVALYIREHPADLLP